MWDIEDICDWLNRGEGYISCEEEAERKAEKAKWLKERRVCFCGSKDLRRDLSFSGQGGGDDTITCQRCGAFEIGECKADGKSAKEMWDSMEKI